jgi:transcriptional regulator GlxA family with amidase domain
VLDLALPFDGRSWFPRARLRDADAVIRAARNDAVEATALLLEDLTSLDHAEADLPDLMARDLSDDPSLSIGDWAARHGLARETAWRRFRKAYHVEPAAYRSEARARRAWRLVMETRTALAEIAAITGFADQAHMTRAVKALTGRPPSRWRAATSVQDAAPAAG